ncbi:MAG: hypothetical protein PGN33_19215 [Methylobacterium radiotolerans]
MSSRSARGLVLERHEGQPRAERDERQARMPSIVGPEAREDLRGDLDRHGRAEGMADDHDLVGRVRGVRAPVGQFGQDMVPKGRDPVRVIRPPTGRVLPEEDPDAQDVPEEQAPERLLGAVQERERRGREKQRHADRFRRRRRADGSVDRGADRDQERRGHEGDEERESGQHRVGPSEPGRFEDQSLCEPRRDAPRQQSQLARHGTREIRMDDIAPDQGLAADRRTVAVGGRVDRPAPGQTIRIGPDLRDRARHRPEPGRVTVKLPLEEGGEADAAAGVESVNEKDMSPRHRCRMKVSQLEGRER